MSDHDLSPFNLTQEQLEDIIIHAAPVTRGNRMTIDEARESGPEKGWNSFCVFSVTMVQYVE